MYTWHNYMSWISTVRQLNLFMYVTVFFQRVISLPTVCKYGGIRHYKVAHKRNQTIARCIRYALHTYSSESFRLMYFNCNHNKRLSSCSATALPSSVFAPNKSLIYFDISTKLITSRSHHGATHLMKPTPRCLVASKAKNTLKSQSISTKFLARYVPDRLKPQLKRLSCSLKDSSGSNRYTVSAGCTTNQICSHFPALTFMAYWADKALGPTKPKKIINTSVFRREPFVKFLQRSRIINAPSGI